MTTDFNQHPPVVWAASFSQSCAARRTTDLGTNLHEFRQLLHIEAAHKAGFQNQAGLTDLK